MALVYKYSSICSQGNYRYRKHMATLDHILKVNGVAIVDSQLEVPDRLIENGIYRLPLSFRSDEKKDLESWGIFKLAPAIPKFRKKG